MQELCSQKLSDSSSKDDSLEKGAEIEDAVNGLGTATRKEAHHGEMLSDLKVNSVDSTDHDWNCTKQLMPSDPSSQSTSGNDLHDEMEEENQLLDGAEQLLLCKDNTGVVRGSCTRCGSTACCSFQGHEQQAQILWRCDASCTAPL
eukprot:2468170-Amphidinium_carterae.1